MGLDSITPNGINHNQTPAFVASWVSGDEVPENKDAESFYYEASGGLDQLLICQIDWQDGKPEPEPYNILMDEAITALDNWISDRM